MSDQWKLDVAARTTAHEFILELLLANFMRSMPEGSAEEFVADVNRVARKAYSLEPVDDPDTAIVGAKRTAEMIDHLLQKALNRSRG